MQYCPFALPLEVFDDAPEPALASLAFLAVRRGVLTVQTPEGRCLVPSGSVYGSINSWTLAETTGAEWLVLRFRPELLHASLGLETTTGPLDDAAAMDRWLIEPFSTPQGQLIALAPEAFAALYRNLESIRRYVNDWSIPSWRCLARSALFDVLHALRRFEGRAPAPVSPADRDGLWVQAIVAHLVEHLEQGTSLPSVAAAFASNRTQFSRDFRARAGQTLGQALKQLRLQKAEWMLRHTDLPVARVAEKVGLQDPTHFTRLMRAHLGTTPLRHRALWRQKAENS